MTFLLFSWPVAEHNRKTGGNVEASLFVICFRNISIFLFRLALEKINAVDMILNG